MNNALLEEALVDKSEKLGIDLKLLAYKFALEYKKYFSWAKLKRMDFNKLDTFKDTRLDLTKNHTLTVAEKKILAFNDVYHLNYDAYTYIAINLKEEVKEIVINSKPKKIICHLDIYNLIENIKEEYGLKIYLEGYLEYRKELYVKSLIYNYIYCLLLKDSATEYDYAVAGMFKNAYFDIISIYENTLDKKMAL
ncbi:MAG: hypothetical protein E7163_01205 [Firmicutes bacterium]|nr:hypothetical protein [Bacillota bacterium]